jgi:S-adenosylmethionine-diacylgycerolhomoserine-N-methlytransferase
MRRYQLLARAYDAISAEPVYRAGRRAALDRVAAAAPRRVLDLGCGTGLNLPRLAEVVGPDGLLVGLDRSPAMTRVAEAKVRGRDAAASVFVHADATALEGRVPDALAAAAPFDAVVSTYALSLMPDPAAAWRGVRGLLRPGAAVAVVDMQRPSGRYAPLAPLARLACLLGGADIDRRPWTAVVPDLTQVVHTEHRGGHVVAVTGRWPGAR